jgi:hypothetical protein
MRTAAIWSAFVVLGIILIGALSAAAGDRDRQRETVAVGTWAQDVCGTIGVWRGAMEAIAEDVRGAAALGDLGLAEPQSQTPQSRSGFVRAGLGRAIEVTEFLVEGIDRVGTPDSPQGPQAERALSDWARAAENSLDDAQDALDDEAETLEASIERVAESARSISAVLTSGRQTLADIAQSDPQLAAALTASSTCQHLQEDTGR